MSFRIAGFVVYGLLMSSVCLAADAPKKVLLVIASQDFFYREYSEPKEELEKAGYKVVVAAAAKGVCRPHANTGQGAGSGEVKADLAITSAKADDYAAIVFSGGWGASMYQYAFDGVYQNGPYNGKREVREAANRLINDMLEDDKYVAGICHGVSVLAWSRVDKQSPLKGKQVAAATVNGPAVQSGHPSLNGPSRAHAELNGAKVTRSQSIGNAGTAADDVVVDGRIITAENDQSARECGRVLAKLLQSAP